MKGRLGVAIAVLAVAGLVGPMRMAVSQTTNEEAWEPTPSTECGDGSKPEGDIQGRAPADDYESGRQADGYTCNIEVVSKYHDTGGYRVHRYVDAQGQECAFFDSTLLWPTNLLTGGTNGPGVFVLDMSDPASPKHTATLSTPAMQSPHESLSLNQRRGLLAAGMGYPTFQPGFVDVYDVSQDCTNPALQSSTPIGIIGHEGEFSPDGNTYWVTSLATSQITAVDLTNPMVPTIAWHSRNWSIHGLNISDDGTRFYGADNGSNPDRGGTDGTSGLTILDVSEVQERKSNPEVRLVSHLSWDTVSIPQTAIPVTITPPGDDVARNFVIEIDEYGTGDSIGAARIVDIDNEEEPTVVSNLRLEVHHPDIYATVQEDPGSSSALQGYRGHYCAVPDRDEPGIVACSFIASGLRVFDIRDPEKPVEIAYANFPIQPDGIREGAFAMSAPTFVPERGEIWWSDGNSGFYNLRVTNDVWPFDDTGEACSPADGKGTPKGLAKRPCAGPKNP